MIRLNLDFNTTPLFLQQNLEKNVKNSRLGIDHVPLDQEDIFTLETFIKIQEERFSNNMDFYICVVKENNHFFFFEGSKFIECFLKDGKKFNNPLTRKEIEEFEVLCCSKDNPLFYSYKTKHGVEELPHYLPILWNDHTRSIEERADYLDQMGDCYYLGKGIKKNTNLAIYFCEKAAKLNFPKACIKLSIIFQESKKENRKSLYFLINFLRLESKKIRLQYILYAADMLALSKNISKKMHFANFYYKKAAISGNYYGIANLILSYEKGDGISHNAHKASLWRVHLPPEWQSQNITKFLKHLKHSKYDHNEIQQISLPQELLEDEPELQPPDPDILFPEVKEDLDRRVTSENLYHFSLEEIEKVKHGFKKHRQNFQDHEDFKRLKKLEDNFSGYESDDELNPLNKV